MPGPDRRRLRAGADGPRRRAGAHGVPALLARVRHRQDGSLPLLLLPARRDNLSGLANLAAAAL
jgi:hypothetical protein